MLQTDPLQQILFGCVHTQGMKDLNLQDEARFQQAPQPDMVSSQVRSSQAAAISRLQWGQGLSRPACTNSSALESLLPTCLPTGFILPQQGRAETHASRARLLLPALPCIWLRSARRLCVLTLCCLRSVTLLLPQVFEGRVVDTDNRSGGHVITATAGSGPNKQTFNYATERVVGNGSFGTVFQATCLETAETVRCLFSQYLCLILPACCSHAL